MPALAGKRLAPSAGEMAYEWLSRGLAGYCLLLGLFYWIRLIGIYEGDNWRFDLMPVHWQVASVTLAVLFPFAASGLWMLASWGPVIWLICALIETVMYAGLPELFGNRLVLVGAHGLIGLSLASCLVYMHIEKRRAAAEG